MMGNSLRGRILERDLVKLQKTLACFGLMDDFKLSQSKTFGRFDTISFVIECTRLDLERFELLQDEIECLTWRCDELVDDQLDFSTEKVACYITIGFILAVGLCQFLLGWKVVASSFIWLIWLTWFLVGMLTLIKKVESKGVASLSCVFVWPIQFLSSD
ncbi:hypothetical protein BC455_22745 [Vibrio harveyi]|uniref:hypothetical protein n=1 Tax=Vibrio harveyi TaxID=669 RepID=UPI0008413CB1|nr:hypothetical protein [Vibrio harveyi]ODM56019.1 hypothetical protein BC455_22745 [Vibrio harveyi]